MVITELRSTEVDYSLLLQDVPDNAKFVNTELDDTAGGTEEISPQDGEEDNTTELISEKAAPTEESPEVPKEETVTESAAVPVSEVAVLITEEISSEEKEEDPEQQPKEEEEEEEKPPEALPQEMNPATTEEANKFEDAVDEALHEAQLTEKAYKEKAFTEKTEEDTHPPPQEDTHTEETHTEETTEDNTEETAEDSTSPAKDSENAELEEPEEPEAVLEKDKSKRTVTVITSGSQDDDDEDEGMETLIDDIPSSYSYSFAESEKKFQYTRRKSSPYTNEEKADLLRVANDNLKAASSLPALNVDDDDNIEEIAKVSISTSQVDKNLR